MGQQEGFRTPAGAQNDAPGALSTPIFDERSALKAAPVVPLEKVARSERFARLAGGWRETVNSPQFRRSWPLALLLVATLAAAVAATNIYNDDDAQTAAPANTAASAATTANVTATADAETTTAPPARDERDGAREARNTPRERDSSVSPDAASVGNSQALAASALGNFHGDDGDAREGRGGAAASGRDERDRGKRQKRSKRRHGARRSGGGAILFDVIR